MTDIIGLSGYAQSGKDTLGSILVEQFGFTRLSFADKLREFLYALDPIVHINDVLRPREVRLRTLVDSLGWESTKISYPEVRSLLQRCGTDAGRKVLGEDVWVNAVLKDLPEKVVFTDVRFVNEANAVVNAGGWVVRINRKGTGPITSPDGSVHPSETALDGFPFDAWVNNDDSLVELEQKAEILVSFYSKFRTATKWAS